MIKVYWTTGFWSNDDAVFLEKIKKMTPGRSGRWKDMVAVSSPDEADFILAWDTLNRDLPLDRTIFFTDIPKCLPSSPTFEAVKDKALLCLEADAMLNASYWYLDYDYDYLSGLKPPDKTKKAICIFTAKNTRKMFTDRIKFAEKLMKLDAPVDIHGYPPRYFAEHTKLGAYYKGPLGNTQPDNMLFEHWAGKEVLADYRYSIEFDNGPTTHYFSERVYDSMLLWAMPLYWGGTTMHEYLPENSFRYIDIVDDSDQGALATIDVINSDFREQHLDDLAVARDLLLNKHQMWPALYEVVTKL